MNPAPGFKKNPGHRIVVKPAGERVQVTFKGAAVADSSDTLVMHEGDYPAVYYFPRKDVRMDRLARTSHQSHCPFKGDASYYSLKDGPENAVWSYETPFDEMSAIKDYLAFYPNKVDAITAMREG